MQAGLLPAASTPNAPLRLRGLALAVAGSLVAFDGGGATPENAPIEWRVFGAAAFREAAASDRPVFLLMTAPWNRDHFDLGPRYLSDPGVVRLLGESFVPILVYVTDQPELSDLYPTPTGLIPGFHFLDVDGAPVATFPPLDPEEFTFFLEEMQDPTRRLPAEASPRETESVPVDRFADVIVERIVERFESGSARLAPPHRNVDLASVAFLEEFGDQRADRDARRSAGHLLREVLEGPLHDRVGGGFHRAAATRDGRELHYEKTLPINAAAGGLLARWYRRTWDAAVGADALTVLRFLNEALRTRGTTLYAGSMAADLLDPETGTVGLEGSVYYSLDPDRRTLVGRPPVSAEVPVGGNFVLHQALRDYFRVFQQATMAEASGRGGRLLLEDGFEEDGTARLRYGEPGRGGLWTQGQAGLGLLAVHAVTGDRDALAAAERLAEALVAQYLDEETGLFRRLSLRDGAPEYVRRAAPDPVANGIALRFLADLGTVTGDARWLEVARNSLTIWADRLPAGGIDAAELGRAALRLEGAYPLLCLAVPSDAPSADSLRILAFRVMEGSTPVRWIDPGVEEERRWAGERGLSLDTEPAIYLLDPEGERPSEAIRAQSSLAEVYRALRAWLRRPPKRSDRF
jgi:uncharacterized protein YyaL (SSP411 family)